MHKPTLNLLFVASIATLAAGCSDGDSDSEVSRDLFNLGTTSNTESGNGLPFASFKSFVEQLSDMVEGLEEGESRTVTTTLLRVPESQSAPSREASEVSVTVTRTGEGEADFTLTLNYDGQRRVLDANELIEMANGEQLLLPDGRVLEIENDLLIGHRARMAQILERDNNLVGVSHVVLGLETNPDALVALGERLPNAGSVTYSGEFLGGGTRMNAESEVIGGGLNVVTGEVQIEARFADMLVGGQIDLRHGTVDSAEYTISFNDVAIEGNGFSTTDTSTACEASGTSCSGTVQLGGAFFGDQAQDVGGLVDFDLSATGGSGGDERLVGGGGYVATSQSLP